ncbi:transporter [Nocardia sp. MDA0666]|uniref:transporter n=1 Tax=Nocardia sp. MDA0666 TaxID=2135448 RepID=UPI000D124932|nr:transporter [Nocardia sp. MDA0666]PSR66896.1 transporter [Nocardia sp. MDA0666]
MKDVLFLLADVWMIVVGYLFGWKLIRRYGNYLLGLEAMVIATSGSNFLVWAMLGANQGSVLYDVAYFFDAFSRSLGVTVILVMGLMRVTHHYKPTIAVDVGVFALATVAGLFLRPFHGVDPRVDNAAFAVAAIYVAVNLATTVFLAYFAKRLWDIGATWLAICTGLATTAGTIIAITYDFFPFPFDDANRTLFYTAALATWGTQLFVYFFGYRALHDRNVASGASTAQKAGVLS